MSLYVTRVDKYPKPFTVTTSEGNILSTAEFQGQWLYLVFHRHLA
jgi:hypothetical protein